MPLLLSLLLACGTPEAPAPDLVVIGLVSAAPPSPARPAAVQIRDGVVQAIVDADAPGAGARILRADRVTPGYVDAHGHPAGLGRMIDELDLNGSETWREVLDRVAAVSGTDWLTGRGWDQNDWPDAPEGGWPRAADLEALHPGRPIALRRVDGHALWVSPAAMAAAGVDGGTPDPPGGRLLRDAAGQPTGVLIDAAMSLVQLPEPTAERRAAGLQEALRVLAAAGLTGVHAMGVTDAELEVYEQLASTGELPIRVWAYADPASRAAERLLATGSWGGPRLRVVGIKTFADGALGSRGALLREDYADEPGHRGLPLDPPEALAALATRALAADVQLAVHAIGDLGVKHALDAFAAARAAHPESSRRLRVEHAQVVHPDDMPRFRALDAVASMQPTHATSDMPWAPARLGSERLPWAYAWQRLRTAGAALALGSDFPVEPFEPSPSLWAATTRTDFAGSPRGGWQPDQRLSLDDAIAGFTHGAAWAVHEEARLGTLAPGRPADLTLWRSERDEEGERLVPVATIVDGKVVWEEE